MIFEKRYKELKKEHEKIKKEIMNPGKVTDRRHFKNISIRYKELEEILSCFEKIDKLQTAINENKKIIAADEDPELSELAKEDINEKEEIKVAKIEELKDLLVPKDPNDNKDAIVEIRAGTGGDEAALFVADLYKMYSYFAEKKGWKKKNISSNPIGVGGFKEIIFSLSGKNVYGTMRFESGVHRVQRIPRTESQGRIHTSAVSVAVLPEADDVEVDIKDKDLKIDVYRSSGHGGQSVNTKDSAVRITHIPSNIVVTCQDEKSQLKNKKKAMKILRSRLLDKKIAEQESKIAQKRKSQVGTGDRSAKIRTYNFPQSRVTDHRINLTTYNLDDVLFGDLDEFIKELKVTHRKEQFTE